MSKERSPVYQGFEYRVRLAVSIPQAWAEFLREVALCHYDGWCRESARSGIVNGLRNTACDSEFSSSFPVSWRDMDHLTKVMEQARYYADSEQQQCYVTEINTWIRQVKCLLVDHEKALAKWASEQTALMLTGLVSSEE